MTMRSQTLADEKTKDMNSQLLKKICLVVYKLKDKFRALMLVAMLYGRFGRYLLGRCRLYEELM